MAEKIRVEMEWIEERERDTHTGGKRTGERQWNWEQPVGLC